MHLIRADVILVGGGRGIRRQSHGWRTTADVTRSKPLRVDKGPPSNYRETLDTSITGRKRRARGRPARPITTNAHDDQMDTLVCEKKLKTSRGGRPEDRGFASAYFD